MWLYGVAFSVSFWFSTLELSLFIQLLPLLVGALFSLLYTVVQIRQEKNPSVELAALATSILFIVLLWTKPDDLYYIFSIVFAIIVILGVVANGKILFVAPPTWLGLGNALSLILSAVIYIMFYASIQDHTEDFYVLLPVGLLLVVEMYIVLNIQNMPDINTSMKSKLRTSRITYFMALLIVFVTTILYISDILDLQTNLFVCVCAYSIGLLWSSGNYIWSMCKNATTKTETIYQIVRVERSGP